MKSPYYNYNQRVLIRSNTMSGDKLYLHLKIQLFKRAVYRYFSNRYNIKIAVCFVMMFILFWSMHGVISSLWMTALMRLFFYLLNYD
jgi:hypothetical protein